MTVQKVTDIRGNVAYEIDTTDPLGSLDTRFAFEQADLLEQQQNIRRIFALCESPIEMMFLFEYLMMANGNVRARLEDSPYLQLSSYMEPHLYGVNLHIYPQYLIPKSSRSWARAPKSGADRVDFLFKLIHWGDKSWEILGSLVVELDGHDYHERTKEQARRDRSRDRRMTANGLTFLRFTGSEIHANIGDVWLEVEGVLSSIANEAMSSGDELESFSYR
jgi:hypothetical protein